MANIDRSIYTHVFYMIISIVYSYTRMYIQYICTQNVTDQRTQNSPTVQGVP